MSLPIQNAREEGVLLYMQIADVPINNFFVCFIFIDFMVVAFIHSVGDI